MFSGFYRMIICFNVTGLILSSNKTRKIGVTTLYVFSKFYVVYNINRKNIKKKICNIHYTIMGYCFCYIWIYFCLIILKAFLLIYKVYFVKYIQEFWKPEDCFLMNTPKRNLNKFND